MDEKERDQRINEYVYKVLIPEGTLLYIGIGRHPEHQFISDLIKKGYKITVLEVYEPYIPIAKAYLDNKYPNNGIRWVIGDIRNADQIFKETFDLVVWSHGPEHIRKEEFMLTMHKLVNLANKQVFTNCPYGVYTQNGIAGNEYETHFSHLYPEDFKGFITATFGEKDSCKGSLIAYLNKGA